MTNKEHNQLLLVTTQSQSVVSASSSLISTWSVFQLTLNTFSAVLNNIFLRGRYPFTGIHLLYIVIMPVCVIFCVFFYCKIMFTFFIIILYILLFSVYTCIVFCVL